RRFLIFAASLATLPALAFAQARGGGRGMMSGSAMARPASIAHPAVSASRFDARSYSSAAPHVTVGTRPAAGMRLVRTRSGALVYRPVQPRTNRLLGAPSGRAVLSQDVPGLGFDFPHFAATHPQGTHDRDHDRNRGFIGAYFPFYGGGYYLPTYPEDNEQAEAPPADVQPVAAEEPAPGYASGRPPAAQSPRDYVPEPQSAAPQQTEEYVFVRRDGTLFFATAFAWENGTLRYITREGLRQTLTLDKIDLNATQKFNEQRGLNFTLPV
ncbi:MAG: hypothetical protein ACRD36_14360, partial [Candidatus Acidiferrum sp.]